MVFGGGDGGGGGGGGGGDLHQHQIDLAWVRDAVRRADLDVLQ